jgi:anti-sigma factor ChrR (cupin superfamily)
MTTLEPQPTPGMSYLAEDDIAWERQTPASRRKILRLDEDLYVAIVQWDAGFELPGLDEHGGEEIVYVLQGTFTDQYRSSGPGTVIRGEAGSSHRRAGRALRRIPAGAPGRAVDGDRRSDAG